LVGNRPNPAAFGLLFRRGHAWTVLNLRYAARVKRFRFVLLGDEANCLRHCGYSL
jgi:hypothetical protein